MSTLDHTLKPELVEVRRLEVITGTGRRRQFSEEAKARIVEETLVPGIATKRRSVPDCDICNAAYQYHYSITLSVMSAARSGRAPWRF